MIRQAIAEGGNNVQHLTGTVQSDAYVLYIPGFHGSIKDVGVIVISSQIIVAANPVDDYAVYEVIDLVNGYSFIVDTSDTVSPIMESCNILNGNLVIQNRNTGIAWQSENYDVTIYMK